MSVAKDMRNEIREEQKKALTNMTKKQKLAYFWEYYKVHCFVVIAVIAIVSTFVYQQATKKDIVFTAYMLNMLDPEDTIRPQLQQEFMEYAQIDTQHEDVEIDTSMFLYGEGDAVSPYAMQNKQKMVVMLQAGEINVLIGDYAGVEEYGKYGFCTDLRTILSPEELSEYEGRIYYTDNKVVELLHDTIVEDEVWAELEAQQINHLNPDELEEPIPTGIVITNSPKIRQLGCYDYLQETETAVGEPETGVVFSIPISGKDPSMALQFLRYLETE